MSRRIAIPVALAVLLVSVAGCVGSAPTASPTTDPPTTSPVPTQPSYLTPAVECPGVEWVAFWAISESERQQFWEPDTARIGFTIAGGETVLFVAYVDGEVAGASEMRYETDGSVTADGSKVELDEPPSGVHTIRVVAHEDSNGNGAFDEGVDRPCSNDGTVVQTDVQRLNFTELEGTSTAGAVG